MIGIKRRELIAVFEHRAIVAVDKRLGRRAIGVENVMAIQLDVEIFEPADAVQLHDRTPVDQIDGRHKNAVDVQRVLGRQKEIAARQIGADRAGGDPDRQNLAVANNAAGITAPPDPFDRLCLAR